MTLATPSLSPVVIPRRLRLACKRVIDVVVAGSLLSFGAPIHLGAGLLVLIYDGRPIFYRQRRAGVDGKEFELLKLRTMQVHSTPASAQGQVGLEHPLLTRSGRILRRFKVDELPQLLSVLRGDMSLVGPRPALVEQAQAYDEEQRRRLTMRPGLTGWAQVNGNVTLSWPQRILLDLWYIDHWSLRLDLAILARTVGVILGGEHPDPRALERAEEHAHRSRRRG